jgi:hypothetical protein
MYRLVLVLLFTGAVQFTPLCMQITPKLICASAHNSSFGGLKLSLACSTAAYLVLAKLLTKHSSEPKPLLYKSAEFCGTPGSLYLCG